MQEHLTEELTRDPNVRGVMLTGSRARGDALPGADVDLLVLVASPPEKTFVSETVDGTFVERHFRDLEGARARLLERPMELYSHLDGEILYDPDGSLAELAELASDRFRHYRVPEKERQAIVYWLGSVQLKLEVATAAGDALKMGYYASTNSWKVLEGLWALNGKPVPPAGAVWAHLPDLTKRPEELEGTLQRLFKGTAEERSEAMLGLIGWTLEAAEDR